MSLSPEERDALRRRADELRTEVSSLTAERDAAFIAQSDSINDAKLVAEVMGLEAQRDAAEKQRDEAVNSTEDAMRIMQEAMEQQELTAARQNAGSSEPALAETNDHEVDVSEIVETKTDPELADVPPSELAAETSTQVDGGVKADPQPEVAETESPSPAKVARKQNGGSR